MTVVMPAVVVKVVDEPCQMIPSKVVVPVSVKQTVVVPG